MTLGSILPFFSYKQGNKGGANLTLASIVQANPKSIIPARVGLERAVAEEVFPKEEKGITTGHVQPERIKIPKREDTTVTSNVFGELSAHPVSTLPKIAAPFGPSGDYLVNSTGDMNPVDFAAGIPELPKAVLPPVSDNREGTSASEQGGQPLRLITSVLPEYPDVARRSGIGGTVLVRVTIDDQGNASNLKVISGPPILRGAALNALRRWKYEPAKTGVHRIAMDTLVAIQFEH
jgi:TonB family protein